MYFTINFPSFFNVKKFPFPWKRRKKGVGGREEGGEIEGEGSKEKEQRKGGERKQTSRKLVRGGVGKE